MEDIKNNYLKDLVELLKSQFSRNVEQRKDKPIFGVVVNNNDPDKYGRCQIRIHGLGMEAIPDKDLPWVTPDQSFVGSLEGSFIVPPNGSTVNIYFKNDDLYDPYYTTKVMNVNNLPSEKNDDYPDTNVLAKWDDGQYITYNRRTFMFSFRHASGAMFTIDKNGDLDIDTTNSNIGGITITARGPLKFTAPTTEVDRGMVSPTGTGYFCALPIDPLTGVFQTGSFGVRQGL